MSGPDRDIGAETERVGAGDRDPGMVDPANQG